MYQVLYVSKALMAKELYSIGNKNLQVEERMLNVGLLRVFPEWNAEGSNVEEIWDEIIGLVSY